MLKTLAKKTQYQAKPIQDNGFIVWSDEENSTWQRLMLNQKIAIKRYACDEYKQGLELLDLPDNRIPQLDEVDRVLLKTTGWSIAPVPALISFDHFFKLLSEKRFPVATFIRQPKDINYLQEPDIFHEIFGHCPMLTNPDFAAFTQHYGQNGLNATPQQRVFLARLYWFTIEFGLVKTAAGMKIYGGGILSSPQETRYAMLSDKPLRCDFDILNILRTPYRIDQLQKKYFELESISQLYLLSKTDLMVWIEQAMKFGLFDDEQLKAC